jgi:DNA-binding beta-propeller fold protein YncE
MTGNVRRRLRYAARISSLALLLLFSSAVPALSEPRVSVRVFASAPALVEDEESLLSRWQFGWRVVAEVRGATQCDQWSLTATGPGGTTFAREGGARQETELVGFVESKSLARLNASARCTIAGQSVDGTAEEAFVDGPATPDATTSVTPPQRVLDNASQAELRLAAGQLANTAVLACHSVARRKLVRGASRLLSVLRPLCVTSMVGAHAALRAASERARQGETGYVVEVAAFGVASRASLRRLCRRIAPRGRRRCGEPLRAAALRYLTAATRSAENAQALADTLSGYDSSGSSGGFAQAAGARAYAGQLADAYRVQRKRAAALMAQLRRLGVDVRLSRRQMKRAERDFVRLAGVPRPIRRRIGSSANPQTARRLLNLRKRNHRDARELRRLLASPLPSTALTAIAQQMTLEMLLESVDRLATDASDPSSSVARREVERRVQRLALLCDPDARAEEARAAAIATQRLGGPHRGLLRRIAAPIAANPPRERPAGCPPPPTPATGSFLQFGGFGAGVGQLDRPTDVAVGPGGIYVADQGNARVQRFAADGTLLGSWGTRAVDAVTIADGEFIEPVGVALDGAGNVYVSDFRADRIQKFSATGAFIGKWGTTGSGDGQFQRVGGLAVDPSGNVYVVDPANSRVQKFSSDGTFLGKFGAQGSGPGQFRAPRGITTDANGMIYVAERDNGRIQVYSPDGVLVREWGRRGLADGEFNGAYDVAIDRAGNVWVADLYGYRLQSFTATGTLLGKLETFGPNRESFNPFAVSFDAQGNLYVADIAGGTGDRIVVFAGVG